MKEASVDALGIGAGAGCGMVAAELAGLRMALFARGRNFSAADFDPDELTGLDLSGEQRAAV